MCVLSVPNLTIIWFPLRSFTVIVNLCVRSLTSFDGSLSSEEVGGLHL